MTHQLVELLGKQVVDAQREQTRQRQQALVAQYISGAAGGVADAVAGDRRLGVRAPATGPAPHPAGRAASSTQRVSYRT